MKRSAQGRIIVLLAILATPACGSPTDDGTRPSAAVVPGEPATAPGAPIDSANPAPAPPIPGDPGVPEDSSGAGPVNTPSPPPVPAVVYDNDDVIDVYTDDLLMALASEGRVELKGMVTTSSVVPFNRFVTLYDYGQAVARRELGVRFAREAGLTGIPDPVAGPAGNLKEPASGRIEDTQPIDAEGSRLIVEAVRALPAGDTLHVVMGGPLTAVADAYLLDPSIAARVQVLWLGGRSEDMGDYNGWADPWAAHIVLERLPLVIFLTHETGELAAPEVTKERLRELPVSPLTTWMIAKDHATNALPDDRDGDAPPAVGLIQPDYIAEWHRVEPDGWVEARGHRIPAFRSDPEGRAIVVTSARRDIATETWWRAVEAALEPGSQARSEASTRNPSIP